MSRAGDGALLALLLAGCNARAPAGDAEPPRDATRATPDAPDAPDASDAADASGSDAAPHDAAPDGPTGLDAAAGGAAVWPLRRTAAPDGDAVRAPYGPRYIGRYDFHAGIDLPAPEGTAVGSVMAGTVVRVSHWDGGTATGAGNSVLVAHDAGMFTAYLHLATMTVREGDALAAGDVLGTVGRTGATYDHLHLTYMRDLPARAVDERRSRNPLEVLPHTDPPAPAAAFRAGAVEITLSAQVMTLRWVTLEGGGASRTADYYAIVALGSMARDNPTQSGLRFGATSPSGGRFVLTVAPDPPDFVPDRVVLRGFDDRVVLDARR